MSIQQTLFSKIIRGLLVCTVLLTTGCYSISKEFPIAQGKVSQYLNCLKSQGGLCNSKQDEHKFYSEHTVSTKRIGTLRDDLPASIAKELEGQNNSSALSVWNDPVQKKLVSLYEYLNAPKKSENVAKVNVDVAEKGIVVDTYLLEFDAEELRDYQTHIQESVQSLGWDALASATESHLVSLHKHQNNLQKQLKSDLPQSTDAKLIQVQIEEVDREVQRAETIKPVAVYVSAYLRAYFRSGEFFKMSLDKSTLEAKLKKELESRIPGLDANTRDSLVANLLKKLQADNLYFGEIGTTGFVSRSGDTYQFPPLEARLDPLAKRPFTVSKIDFAVIGADLVRVVLEATFDAISMLPAVSNATGAVSENIPAGERLSVNDPVITKVNGKQFGEVNTFAGQTEAATSTAFGQLIRGAGWVSLNNEYLGKLLETLVGVTVRKIMEQCAWCYYACGLDGQQQNPPKEKTIVKVKVTGSRGFF